MRERLQQNDTRVWLTQRPRGLGREAADDAPVQPLIATLLGIRSGRADARAGRPPYLFGVLFHRDLRGELVRTGFETVVNLLLMGILLDAVFQWVILGVSHPAGRSWWGWC